MNGPAALVPGDIHHRERGQSLITSAAAIAVFLGFLMFAVHVCVNLYANSTVTANAYDAARRVASAQAAGDRQAVADRAGDDLEENLGDLADRIEVLEWTIDGDMVELHIVIENPSFLIFSDADVGLGKIDKRVRVRIEEVQ